MTVRLRVEAHGFMLEVDPEHGAAITAFARSGADGGAILRPAPAELQRMYDAACFPLAPFCNRIRDGVFTFRGRRIELKPNVEGEPSPIHGQAWQSPWQVLAREPDSLTLSYSHPAGEWPWSYEVVQTLRLIEGGLVARLRLTNTDAEPMPAGLGFHPYYPCDPDTVLDAQVACVWSVDARVLPVERMAATGRYDLNHRRIDRADLDNGYDGWIGRATLTWPTRGQRLTLMSESGFLQVYAPAEGGLVVVEPVTHANDALSWPEADWARLGMAVVEPGASLEHQATFLVAGT